MTKLRHYNIPIFIPELACPHQCVFCNQREITGIDKVPNPEEISRTIETHLSTIENKNSVVQVAFFGGSFTGIPYDLQEEFLKQVQPFIADGRISSIRLSTRPDYINEDILLILKRYGVANIELGAQSMDDDVLKKSGRGHDSAKIVEASGLIKKFGFELGLQMMIGLPGDSELKAIETARKIVDCGATETRIYPTLIIKNTVLEKQWEKGKYIPLELSEAVKITAKVYRVFEENNVRVLRTGLHPSEDLVSGKSYLAGPFHPSFKELVYSEIWRQHLAEFFTENQKSSNSIQISVNPSELNFAIGHRKTNLNYLYSIFELVRIKPVEGIKNRDFDVDYL